MEDPLLAPPWQPRSVQQLDDDLVAKRAERRAACLCATLVAIIIGGTMLYYFDEKWVTSEAQIMADYVEGLSTPATIGVLGAAVFIGNFIPGPIQGASIITAGYVLGLEVGFLSMYPFHTGGEWALFLAARCCCTGSAVAILQKRKQLAAAQRAILSGGLKMVVLIKLIPFPPLIINPSLAGMGVPFWQFAGTF